MSSTKLLPTSSVELQHFSTVWCSFSGNAFGVLTALDDVRHTGGQKVCTAAWLMCSYRLCPQSTSVGQAGTRLGHVYEIPGTAFTDGARESDTQVHRLTCGRVAGSRVVHFPVHPLGAVCNPGRFRLAPQRSFNCNEAVAVGVLGTLGQRFSMHLHQEKAPGSVYLLASAVVSGNHSFHVCQPRLITYQEKETTGYAPRRDSKEAHD